MIFWQKFLHFLKLLVNPEISETRQAWRAGTVSVAALLLNKFWIKNEYPLWILFTAIVCLQTNLGATLKKSRQRIFGTVFGCAVAFLISYLFPERYFIFGIVLLVTIVFWYLNSTRSYTYTVFFMTLSVMMLYFSIYSNGVHFAILRIEDVAYGAVLGSLGLLFIWPEFARKSFIWDLNDVNLQLNNFFLVCIDWLQDKKTLENVHEQKILSSTSLQTARNRMKEISYELGIQIVSNRIGEIFYRSESSNFPFHEYEDIVNTEVRIHYALLTLFNALLLEHFEDKEENFNFYTEKMEYLHKCFEASLQPPHLRKEKIPEPTQPNLTNIKLISFFDKVSNEIETLQKAIDKLKT